jgi:hypothetical protein
MVEKKRVAVMAIIVVAIVIVSGAFYFLVIQNSNNQRPIKAGPDMIVLTKADLPAGWTVNTSIVNSFENTSGAGPGWNWGAESGYTYPYNGTILQFGITIESWNSTGLAHEQYLGMLDDWKDTGSTPISLGDEGSMLKTSFAANDSAGMVAYSAAYAFRVGNVFVTAGFYANGTNLYYETAWMRQMVDIQSAKLYQNEH